MWLFGALFAYICITGAIFVKLEAKCGDDEKYSIKLRYTFILLSMGLLAVLTVLRSQHVGNDTQTYLQLFYALGKNGTKLNTEFGFTILTKIIALVTNNPYALTIVCSLFTYTCFMRFVQKNTKTCLDAFMAVSVLYLTQFRFLLSGMRQGMAMAILAAFAFDFLVKRKPVKFLISVFAAFSFHYTSAIFLIMYPLIAVRDRKKHRILVGIMLGGTTFCFIFFNQLISVFVSIVPKYSYFVSDKYMANGIRPASLLNLAVIGAIIAARFIFVHGTHVLENRSSEKGLIAYDFDVLDKIAIIGICISIIALRLNALDRLASYFTMFFIIYIPFIIANAKKERRILVACGILGMLLAKSFLEFYLRPDWNTIFPYIFFFME